MFGDSPRGTERSAEATCLLFRAFTHGDVKILSARKKLAAAEKELRDAVEAARDAGDSWAVIGAAMDTSRQAAFQRFGR